MDDVNAERKRLREELQIAEANLVRQMYAWGYSVGPFHLNRAVLPRLTSRIYVAFNLLCFVTGVVLAPQGGAFDTVGVSLIVGALFRSGHSSPNSGQSRRS